MSDGIAEFLATRLNEDEVAYWAVHDVAKCDALLYEDLPATAPLPDARTCECGYPARVLREVEAGRRFLARHRDDGHGFCAFCAERADEFEPIPWPCPDVLDRAAIYSTHPDYRAEWKP